MGPGFPGASWRPSLWDEGALALLAAGFPFLHFLSPERVGAGGRRLFLQAYFYAHDAGGPWGPDDSATAECCSQGWT